MIAPRTGIVPLIPPPWRRQDPPDDWPDAAKRRWMSVLVRYAGDAEPLERQPDRHPAAVWQAGDSIAPHCTR